MATFNSELINFTARFLLETDVSPYNYTFFSKKGLKTEFRNYLALRSSAYQYLFDDVMKFLMKKKFVYFKQSQVIMKPLYIDVFDGQAIMFTLNPSTMTSAQFFVCWVCNRGFPSFSGCTSHQQSEAHRYAALNLAKIDEISSKRFLCSIQGCGKEFSKRQELENHYIKEEFAEIPNEVLGTQSLQPAPMVCPYTCDVCDLRFSDYPSMLEHVKERRHIFRKKKSEYIASRPKLLGSASGVKVSFVNDALESDAVLHLSGEVDQSQSLKVVVTNTYNSSSLKINSCAKIESLSSVAIEMQDHLQGVILNPKERHEIEMSVKSDHIGRFRIPLELSFSRAQSFRLLREILYQCVSDQQLFEELKPNRPYLKPKVKLPDFHHFIPSDSQPDIKKNYALERVINLENYSIPNYIYQSIDVACHAPGNDRIEVLLNKLKLQSLTFDNYSCIFNKLLYFEEIQMWDDVAHYAMYDVQLRKSSRERFFQLNVPGLAENKPSVLRGDRLYATVKKGSVKYKYEGYIHRIALNNISIGFNKKLIHEFHPDMVFDIEFTLNRLAIKLEHRAVTDATVPRTDLEHLLFPSSRVPTRPFRNIKTINLKFFNEKIGMNKEQLAAVKHIVCGTSRPAPYLVFGPPGTGKTFTLVEAIKQVYKEFPNSKILACASQNAAADLLIKRLLDHIPKDEILRLNALSRPYGEVDPQVKSVSNYRAVCSQELSDLCKDGDMIAEYPSRNTLMRKRVIVSTLVTSGRLVSADMRSHFTHIFIDEAGQATEPEAVIPISGLLDIKIGQLVLVGDPQQLGPVIRSPIASKARLGISLLERLMSYDIYQRDARSGHFNQNYVTKLVRSFRSHPDILEVPNSCFYENELQACANRMQREKFCNWEGLPSKNFPLIFHGVDGKEEQEDKSPSWFNRFEVMQVLSYAQDLLKCKSLKVTPDHIGIISPYHQQVKKITQALKTADSRNEGTCLNLAKIKVGSVERFQGDERDAIIISTVRSQESFLTHDRDFKIGFVGNPKRFNVAVTRAKALLIVIGNPAILRKDKNWFRLLMHIEEGGGYTGSPLPEDISADESCGYVSGYSNESGYGETNGILEHVEPEMSHNEREIS